MVQVVRRNSAKRPEAYVVYKGKYLCGASAKRTPAYLSCVERLASALRSGETSAENARAFLHAICSSA
eukprot:10841510-Lingulodinium_polyedra.AAC.1